MKDIVAYWDLTALSSISYDLYTLVDGAFGVKLIDMILTLQASYPHPFPGSHGHCTPIFRCTIIAQMSEGVVRASSEKVNVARHTYDLVSFSFPSSL